MKMNANMYFLAVLAPQEVKDKILQWQQYMRDRYRCVAALRSPPHITLIPPFWMDEKMEEDLGEEVNSFSSNQSPFEIELQNFDAFRPKVIFVQVKPVPELLQLQTSLESFLLAKKKYPIKKEDRPFHPHLTIAYRDLRKKDFAEAFAHFSKMNFNYSFRVNEIALLKHQLTQWAVVKKIGFPADSKID